MTGDLKMLQVVVSLALMWSMVHGSGVHHLGAPIANAPVVTAASSQYFQRTFNRLVAAPQVVSVAAEPAPAAVPIAPVSPVFHVAPQPPVFLQAAQPVPVPLAPPQFIPVQSVQPVQRVPNQPAEPTATAQPNQPAQPNDPNVSISIATANAAAPIATILLPPYPFGFPPAFGFIPQGQPSNVDNKSLEPEQTTTTTTTQVEFKTTREPEATTPLPAASDNDFSQVAPSNQDVNFKQYFTPAPQQPQGFPSNHNVNFNQFPRPQTSETRPLQTPQGLPSNQNVNFRQYIPPVHRPQAQPSNQNFNQYAAPAPPLQRPSQPLPLALPSHYHTHDHHHYEHPYVYLQEKPKKLKTYVEVVKAPLAYIAPPALPHFSHNHEAIKVVKHVHTYVPTKAKLIIRPVSHHHTRSIPVKVIEYKARTIIPAGRVARIEKVRDDNSREVEFTTPRPYNKVNTKPPKL